jgi:DNA-directed RNA polymerase subunit alpha
MSPVDAVSHSAAILVEQLTAFVNYVMVSKEEEKEQRLRLSIPEELCNMPVENLNLSVRTMNCLRRGGIDTVGQLVGKGEKGLMGLRNFGQKSKQEIEERLEGLGLSLTPQEEEDSAAAVEEGMEHET